MSIFCYKFLSVCKFQRWYPAISTTTK